jgi:hypothetical protein
MERHAVAGETEAFPTAAREREPVFSNDKLKTIRSFAKFLAEDAA